MKSLCFGLLPMDSFKAAQGGERVGWEYHSVTLTRVPGYGFGIAVSGGRDNPQFTNGDPSIAISDVLKAGPAEGKLQMNDRVISANGISLENVDYATAVQVLRECGSTVNLMIKRRVVLPSAEPQTMKVTLTKSKKKDDFGIVLGYRIYIKEINNKAVVEKDGTLQEGDIIVKINNTSTENMTFKEAKKIIENTKEKLQLILRREGARPPPPTNVTELSSPSNFVDVTGARPHWSNQNLYVQPPTRGDFRPPLPPERPEDKNNLSRMQAGGNRGPIMDISLSQLDQPATPLLTGHGNSRQTMSLDEEEPPPRPPPPRVDEYGNRKEAFEDDPLNRRGKPLGNLYSCRPDPRFISFQKDGSVGIRLTGGNETGIFVTAVQPGSPAFLQGLQPGDKILKVNDMDMRGVTREEAVLFLLSVQDQVDLIVQHRKEEYDEIVANQRGDSLYVRTHFNYSGTGKNELNFHVGEVFHVIDTLYNGVVGSWLVYRIGRNNQEIQKGVIPNKNRAEELAQEQHNQAKKDAASESRGSFFKRRSARRSKSLSKDHWEDVVFADGLSKFPAYERVTLKHPGFIRPVVFFGPLADVARDKLLKDYPDKYASPQLDGHLDDVPKSQKSSGIIRLSAIKEIIEKGKHAILDITPSAVDRLNYAQFYPIVIFMRAENKHAVKELRSRLAKSSHKSSRKLYDHAVKLEKLWSHIFTATITLAGADMWYKKLREAIEKQQQQAIWVSEAKPEEAISDDFLFPMTSRLSYASSPESDLDLTSDTRSGLHDRKLSPGTDRRMVKSSSDPSIATQEDTGGHIGYGQPPPYAMSRPRQEQLALAKSAGQEVKDHNMPSSPKNDADRGDYYGTAAARFNVDPYATLTASERYGSTTNGDVSGWPEPQEPPDYINTGAQKNNIMERTNGRQPPGGFDSSSYSSDSYNKYSGNPSSPIDDAKNRDRYGSLSSAISPRGGHDPYRFTRSTAQPVKPMGMDRGRMPQVPSKYRAQDDRPPPPSPPPKPSNYQARLADGRPVPPPKPAHYQQQQRSWRPEDSNGDSNNFNRPGPEVPTTGPRSPDSAPPPYIQHRNSQDSSDYLPQPPYYSPRSHHGIDPPPPPRPPPPGVPGEHRGLSSAYMNQSLGSPNRRPYSTAESSSFSPPHSGRRDHSYDVRSFGKAVGVSQPISPTRPTAIVNGGGPYHNVPYPPGTNPRHRDSSYQSHSEHHTSLPPPALPSSLLDLSNRENRGSAFELYRKPDTRSPPGMPPSLSIGSDQQKSEASDSPENTPSHNVVATARGKFNSSGGTLTCEETGVSIIIPPNAIPEGGDQEIYFKVCQDSTMLPPLDKEKGETLLSPLVMCGPHGLRFNIPVELRLPHCASVNPESWSFALKSSETPSGQPAEWQNVSLDSMDGVTNSHIGDNYVSVLVDHF